LFFPSPLLWLSLALSLLLFLLLLRCSCRCRVDGRCLLCGIPGGRQLRALLTLLLSLLLFPLPSLSLLPFLQPLCCPALPVLLNVACCVESLACPDRSQTPRFAFAVAVAVAVVVSIAVAFAVGFAVAASADVALPLLFLCC
jgi:hypothetical protein